MDYLNNRENWQGGKVRLTGLVAPRLFIPSENMLRFRQVAKQEMARHQSCGFERLPGWAEWFRDWAMPHRNFGQQITFPRIAPRDTPRIEATTLVAREVSAQDADQVATTTQDASSQPPRGTHRERPGEGTKPNWDGERELSLGGRLLKKFGAQPAVNQVELLAAFQRANWTNTIPNPFGNRIILKDTCKFLNRSMPNGTIRFGSDGAGGVAGTSCNKSPAGELPPFWVKLPPLPQRNT